MSFQEGQQIHDPLDSLKACPYSEFPFPLLFSLRGGRASVKSVRAHAEYEGSYPTMHACIFPLQLFHYKSI